MCALLLIIRFFCTRPPFLIVYFHELYVTTIHIFVVDYPNYILCITWTGLCIFLCSSPFTFPLYYYYYYLGGVSPLRSMVGMPQTRFGPRAQLSSELLFVLYENQKKALALICVKNSLSYDWSLPSSHWHL